MGWVLVVSEVWALLARKPPPCHETLGNGPQYQGDQVCLRTFRSSMATLTFHAPTNSYTRRRVLNMIHHTHSTSSRMCATGESFRTDTGIERVSHTRLTAHMWQFSSIGHLIDTTYSS